ncbi:MAG: osmotically inducible protein C, partial [Gemmatimonadota bacterium]|nr:osmotically inducible protein C [Gemmatimonadota bacterium]
MSAIEREQPDTAAVTSAAADDRWVTAHTGAAGYRTDVGVRSHEFIADEPASVGGAAGGPTPY